MARSFLNRLFAPRPRPSPERRSFRPRLEALEDRWAPAVLNVTTNADSGPGSLRAVVNTASPGDIIHFAIQGQTINLTTGQISLNVSLTIDGQNNGITISSGQTSRVFYNPVASLTEEIDNLTFLNNKATNNGAPDFGRGGAVYDGGNLTLTNDFFTECSADGSGGAVYNAGGTTLTVTNCKFQSNTSSTNGGGLCVDYVAGDPGVNVVLDHTSFNSDFASQGGGVYAFGATANTLLVKNACSFSMNSAGGSFGAGGALYTGDKLTVQDGASFTSNRATGGGGAIAWYGSTVLATDSTTMTLKNSTFTNNSSSWNGGAVFSNIHVSQGAATASITGCLFNGNQATSGKGGGLYVVDTTSGTGTASLSVTNSTFYNGNAQYGGGIALDNSVSDGTSNTVTLTSLTMNKNQASTQGGGLWISSATSQPGLRPQIDNTIIAGNTINNPPSSGPDVFGNALSLGFNLIGITDGSSGVGNGTPGQWQGNDITGTSANPKNPGLDPNGPTDNGGSTFTIKLVAGSPAYRAGDAARLGGTTDQRGYIRPGNGNPISIGAYDPDATKPPG